MAEIALRTTERKCQKEKYLGWRPVGSTIVCIPDSMLRRKWLEICCDLVSPKKRDQYMTIPGWKRLCEAWTPELREAWFETDRGNKTWPLGRLLMDKAFPQQLWEQIIEPVGIIADLPQAPEASRKVCDTWLWSEHERKSFFIVVNDDAADEEVQSWQGNEARDLDTGEVLPELEPGQHYDPKIKLGIVWNRQVRYWSDLGLPGAKLDDITNPDKVLHPRFDLPVGKVKVIRPDVADAKGVA